MARPSIWQMVSEAINNIGGVVTYSQIKNYINQRWKGVNQDTIDRQTIVLSVNHNSRIYYPENEKPRLTNSNSAYDLLFNVGRGKVVKYNPVEHGIWEIYRQQNNELAVRKTNEAEDFYTFSDIIWFKNVTNKENGEAYLDLTDDKFVLHFPTIHKTNAKQPAVGEIILIRQKVNGIPSFTHLVTPVDDELIEGNARIDYQYGRNVKVIAKTRRENFIPVAETSWNKLRYGGITQGNACRIKNISGIGNVDEMLLEIWTHFNSHFSSAQQKSESITTSVLVEIENTNPELSVLEGALKLATHMVKERNRAIVNEKKRIAIQNGTLKCEVCAFSFPSVYNQDFIECHHLTPIAEPGIRETSLSDLALVCANCHRMLHRKFDNKFLSIRELQIVIESLNS